ncbi:hypothetical protein [Nesterenkonia flava]|uniref:Uncharacterized protein n=1 Tax=Nesterenkonia flava TaxID=469799 RepID=A0ABU1FWZ8_9MICC|nr:hypothetical protein [Nesterenkonia flava]MDR5713138.1 hypothetical protein [Nesterenkonia flava]
MHYLTPPGNLRWIDYFPQDLLEPAKAGKIDVEKLDWKPAEEIPLTQNTLEIALRHGHAVAGGILVETWEMSAEHRLRDSERMLREAEENTPKVAAITHPLLREGAARESDLLVNSSKELIQRHQKQLEELMAGDRDPVLQEHWRKLGGE